MVKPGERSWSRALQERLEEAAGEAFEQPFGMGLEAKARTIEGEGAPGSREWCAREIVLDIEATRAAIARGDARSAAGLGLRIGVMARHADLWPTAKKALKTREAQREGARYTAALKRAQYASWIADAQKLRARHPHESILEIARRIDPKRHHTVRRVIGKIIGRADQ